MNSCLIWAMKTFEISLRTDWIGQLLRIMQKLWIANIESVFISPKAKSIHWCLPRSKSSSDALYTRMSWTIETHLKSKSMCHSSYTVCLNHLSSSVSFQVSKISIYLAKSADWKKSIDELGEFGEHCWWMADNSLALKC